MKRGRRTEQKTPPAPSSLNFRKVLNKGCRSRDEEPCEHQYPWMCCHCPCVVNYWRDYPNVVSDSEIVIHTFPF